MMPKNSLFMIKTPYTQKVCILEESAVSPIPIYKNQGRMSNSNSDLNNHAKTRPGAYVYHRLHADIQVGWNTPTVITA